MPPKYIPVIQAYSLERGATLVVIKCASTDYKRLYHISQAGKIVGSESLQELPAPIVKYAIGFDSLLPDIRLAIRADYGVKWCAFIRSTLNKMADKENSSH